MGFPLTISSTSSQLLYALTGVVDSWRKTNGNGQLHWILLENEALSSWLDQLIQENPISR